MYKSKPEKITTKNTSLNASLLKMGSNIFQDCSDIFEFNFFFGYIPTILCFIRIYSNNVFVEYIPRKIVEYNRRILVTVFANTYFARRFAAEEFFAHQNKTLPPKSLFKIYLLEPGFVVSNQKLLLQVAHQVQVFHRVPVST